MGCMHVWAVFRHLMQINSEHNHVHQVSLHKLNIMLVHNIVDHDHLARLYKLDTMLVHNIVDGSLL
uniref:Uncharacterized protein n=1 Tax=Triticum urartu TaxID=4572 RepID=A0A8R7TJ78_TRIUA